MTERSGARRARRAAGDAGAARADAEDRIEGLTGLRWPWALLAVALGAAGGAAVALLVRRQLRPDPPGAQEPHQLRAVVDQPAHDPPA